MTPEAFLGMERGAVDLALRADLEGVRIAFLRLSLALSR